MLTVVVMFFCSFIDFNKAFDSVNYWKLFNKLLNDNTDANVAGTLAYWYSNQQICVRWLDSTSNYFTTGNGTRQGSVLSPYLFCRYISELLAELSCSGIGCNIGGMLVNVLAYADDLVLLAPSWRALQQLLDILQKHINTIDLTCNVKKSVCMIFRPRHSSEVVSSCFPCFRLGCKILQFVTEFKYLGHVINNSLTDDDDVRREICNMFVRTNILLRRFVKCIRDVKVIFFKTSCICLYNVALWSRYNLRSMNKLMACYNKCVIMFFGYKRRDRVTEMLFNLRLPSFLTILHNSLITLNRCWFNCYNELVIHLGAILK